MRFRLLASLLGSLLIVASVATLAWATDFAVIVHPSNSVKGMLLADLGKIVRGKTTAWPNGRNITIILRDPNSPTMKFVLDRVLGVSADEGKALLSDPTRKGGNTMIFVPDDEAVVKAVEANPAAIGIVDVYNITSGVKVLKIDEKQPFDPGYVLKGH